MAKFKFTEEFQIQRPIMVGEFLIFTFREKTRSGITEIWNVDNKQNQPLGVIHYKVSWRTYVFETNLPTTYDAKCLKEITTFVEALNSERDKRIAG